MNAAVVVVVVVVAAALGLLELSALHGSLFWWPIVYLMNSIRRRLSNSALGLRKAEIIYCRGFIFLIFDFQATCCRRRHSPKRSGQQSVRRCSAQAAHSLDTSAVMMAYLGPEKRKLAAYQS